MSAKQTLADRLKSARGSAQLTPAQAAKQANISRVALAEIEAGRQDATALDLAFLAKAYGQGIAWFTRGLDVESR